MTREPNCVLVVEDDEDIRDAIVGILESEGYSASVAGHGADALAQLRAGSRPCLILLDLMMPVMDGWTFYEEMEKEPSIAAIPVVVLSAVSRQDPRNARVRAVDQLSKPVNLGKLLSLVERYC